MPMIGNLLKYIRAKNYQNRPQFDQVIAKIKWCSFFTHMVVAPALETLTLCCNYN